MKSTPTLAARIEYFFTERLIRQRGVSPHTIASYRDTFCQLFKFAQTQLHRSPSSLALSDLDAPLISAFLDDLETTRSVSARTRNLRLTAIRSFFHFIAFEEPAHSAQIQRVLAIPSKRHQKKLVQFMTRPEIEALLEAPVKTTWIGRRDHALLLLAIQTGLRLSELITLNRDSVVLSRGAHVRCVGKGRKERCTPLTRHTVGILRTWLQESRGNDNTKPLFPTIHGSRLSADAVQYLLAKYAVKAGRICQSLNKKHISPHVLRHTAAMELLQAGVDCSTIALWLGHESDQTTQSYLHAHLALKEAALKKVKPLKRKAAIRYRPSDRLLEFLNAL